VRAAAHPVREERPAALLRIAARDGQAVPVNLRREQEGNGSAAAERAAAAAYRRRFPAGQDGARALQTPRGQAAVHPKTSHLGLLLVLDRSNEDRGHGSSARRKQVSRTSDTALLLPAAASSPASAEKKLGRGPAAGGYGFPLLLEDKEAVIAGREIVLSPPQPPLLQPPLPK